MRPYVVLMLRWAVTLALSYGLIENNSIYGAVGLIWAMAWLEAGGTIMGQILAIIDQQQATIEALLQKRVTEDSNAIMEILEKLTKLNEERENGNVSD